MSITPSCPNAGRIQALIIAKRPTASHEIQGSERRRHVFVPIYQTLRVGRVGIEPTTQGL
jgi:hypothetical protein